MKFILTFFFFCSVAAFSQATNHQKWNELLKKYVSVDGSVNYKSFKKQENVLNAYLLELSTQLPQKNWSKNATLAYWINAYNAFTVKLILINYPIKSIRDLPNPWGKKFFTLSNKKYSLEEVENEILRKMNEPRIHFAINCASYSCPNLLNEAYTEAKCENQLERAAKAFVNDSNKNKITTDEVKISQIFNWFAADFKKYGSIIDFLNKYTTSEIDNNAKVKFLEYKWNLNE